MARSKQSPVLLMPEDEEEIAAVLRRCYPGIQILDGSVPWESPDSPPVRGSLAEVGMIASIWNPAIYPTLPLEVRTDGSIWGPQAGPVIQWVRSRIGHGERLKAGRWAAIVEDDGTPEMGAFISDIWKILFRFTNNKLCRVDLRTGDLVPQKKYRVGPEAFRSATSACVELYDGQMKLVPAAFQE